MRLLCRVSGLTGGANSISSAATEITFDNMTNMDPRSTVTYNKAVNITNNAGVSKTITIDVILA
jgi:hypothetical protein